MAREARLRIGLRQRAAAKKIGYSALAGACAADNGDVQRSWRLLFHKRINDIAYQRRRQPQCPSARTLISLSMGMLLQPGEIVDKLAGQVTDFRTIHGVNGHPTWSQRDLFATPDGIHVTISSASNFRYLHRRFRSKMSYALSGLPESYPPILRYAPTSVRPRMSGVPGVLL